MLSPQGVRCYGIFVEGLYYLSILEAFVNFRGVDLVSALVWLCWLVYELSDVLQDRERFLSLFLL